MPTETIRISGLIPATPKRVYDAWLDGKEHSRFTGNKPATVDPTVGGKFTAWDGYIQGKNLELGSPRRIVQSWRTTDFPKGAPDSRLEVVLSSRGGGESEIVLVHSNIPEGLGHQYEEGWINHYLTPMRRYFSALAAQAAKAKLEPKPVPKPAAPKQAAPKPAAKPAKPVQRSTLRTKKAKLDTKKRPAAKSVKKSAPKKSAKSKPARRSAAKRRSR